MRDSLVIPFWVIYVNGGFGILCGLLPLILGFKRGNIRLGAVGFVVCTIAGFLLSLLGALPIAALFAYFILRRKRNVGSRANAEI